MHSPTLRSLVLATRLCLAQRFPDYNQFRGNSSGPTDGVSPQIREKLDQADTNPNASHTVRLTSPGNGDWDWKLQISDVSVPGISNSTPDAHIAFTTWDFSRTDGEQVPSKRAEDSPVCAYLMDFNFPYNVSSQWDPESSSCVSALGASCVSALSAARTSDNCDTKNAPNIRPNEGPCAGMFVGGPGERNNLVTTGLRMSSSRLLYALTTFANISEAFNARDVSNGAWAYALTAPYEGSNATAFQAASERLRIMLLTGPEGSDLFCNRVARTVEIGAEDDSDSENGQSSESGGTSAQGDGSDSGDDESKESAATTDLPHFGGLGTSAVLCGLAAYWL
jgi:hypothetical protein